MKACALVAILALLGAAQVQSAEEVKIGVWLPMTGSLGERGLAAWNGIKIAEQMEGSMSGPSITLIPTDSQSDGFEAVNALLRLIERDGLAAVIGGLNAGNTVAGSFCTRRRGIALVSPAVVGKAGARAENFLFPVRSVGSNQGPMAARFAVERLSALTAVILSDVSDGTSVEEAEAFREEFEKLGGSIVARDRIKRGDRDFSGLAGRIWKTRAEVVYAPVSHVECALMARQVREMGLQVPLIGDEAIQVPTFVSLGGVAVEGVYCIDPNAEQKVLTKDGIDFRKRYGKAFGTNPPTDAAKGAEAYFMVLEAIRRAGSADPVKIREALSSAPNPLRLTVYDHNESGGAVGPGTSALQVRGGKFTPVGSGPTKVSGTKEWGETTRRLRVRLWFGK